MAQKKSWKSSESINLLKSWINNPKIDDLIVFGSFIKGKKESNDIDVAAVFSDFSEKVWNSLNNLGKEYHFTRTKFSKILEEPLLWQTLIHEGYSLKKEDMLSNILGISSYFLFEYQLDNLDKTKRQIFSHALYGTGGRKSFLESLKGQKLGSKKVIVPFDKSEEMRSFFDTWNIVYTVKRIWI